MPLTYIPFPEIRQHERVAVVDSTHPTAYLTLSHWRGAPQLPGMHDDTSTGIVLNALKAQLPELAEVQGVTNNHWDIDGFLGVWAMLHQEQALSNDTLLRRMAAIGDFREYEPQRPEEDLALKLVCWLNAEERKGFYAPFDAPESAAQEAKASVPKYTYFLETFSSVLEDPEAVRAIWEPEYQRVREDHGLLQQRGTVLDYPQVRLRVVTAPRPIHYYALFANTAHVDMVLSLYPDGQYELEQKYTTWVDVAHRKSFPRADLRVLARELTPLETHGANWQADSPFDTGPILRVVAGPLTKAQRFDHPTSRPFAVSSVPEGQLVNRILAWLEEQYSGILPKVNWTWTETRNFHNPS
ncbi:MAG TPA: hypothetical protein DCE41_09780 [Cytophagales bacterium]|nr:hypothetical protein [Cytophagales bacterium]HAA20170.1 hypothetical protein [Cytophagales bacterium]HAP64156.1 hypothetical protein [Cytophagales bacterium]